ncbi:MAG TPA: hypothetical protein DD640_08385, partial [Clostridiales bacterium]|nr:hypothetical protein [Clostridiales bacterium]
SSTTGFHSGDSAGTSRETGFRDYLEQCRPDIGFKGTFRCSTGETPLIIREIIRKHTDLNGFYFAEFTQLFHNFHYLADLGRRYVVIGHEYADPYLSALQDGTITAILSQARVCQGYYPLKILYQYLITGENPSQEIYYSNVNIIIGSNAEYLKYSNNGCGFE